MNRLSAATSAGDSADKPASPIDSAVIDLVNSQHRTNDLLDLLERRLESVLMVAPPTPENVKPKLVTSGMTSLHSQLLESGERTYQLNERLHEMIDRLVVG